jgi:FAD-dependent urate hydroxylase
MKHDGLAVLEARVANDLARISHPRAQWLEPRIAGDGQPAYDVLIVGAGQSGVVAAFGLMRSQVGNILVLDQAEAGAEGPWTTYGRMHTLRSPKDFHGPDLDLPSLTYRSWHEAKHGVESWQALDLIPRTFWNDYLLWFRSVVGVPIRNEARVVDIGPASEGLLAATLADGSVLHARKVLLATGQEGMGGWVVPPPLDVLPASLRAHVAEPIDFAALAGRRVAVVGAGASAFDNAATALEAGAAEVHVLCRRSDAQVVQPYRWLTFRGFLRHLSDLDDAWRWRFMSHILSMREGFPQATFDRCAAHDNFHLHLGAPVRGARAEGDTVHLTLQGGRLEVDFVIAATGIEIDPMRRRELRRFAGNIASWADRYAPPEAERNDRLGRFPYLAANYALTERVPGLTPWIRDIHLFSIASTMSFGASGSSINAMTTAVPKLVAGITRDLFSADVERHWRSLLAYDEPQAVLRPTARASST